MRNSDRFITAFNRIEHTIHRGYKRLYSVLPFSGPREKEESPYPKI